uniref:Tubulin tyrosine ligase-like family, member 12 n=1 Tax=Hippocampus comes TaxID=109280 RepID=A0A3Q2XU93_HIPCM
AGEVFAIILIQENYDDSGKTGECTVKDKPGTMRSEVVDSCQSGLQASHIFLVDHAWTYRVDHARQQLQQIPGLLSRMASLRGLDFSEKKNDADVVDLVMEHMWLYNQPYQLSQGCAEEKIPVWYIMDEFGSQVRHSDQPSCGMAPLFFAEAQAAFTVLWPLRDLQKEDEITRDFVYGEVDPLLQQCRLLQWISKNLLFSKSHSVEFWAVLRENKEQLPVEIHPPAPPKGQILKVYSEMSQVIKHLTRAGFELTENEKEADIIWSYNHIKDYRKFSMDASDAILMTFNLHTELPQFIRHYQDRQQRGQDNDWICKPWNLARVMDIHITNNLNYIIRQRASTPKVVCKYIEDLREDVGLVKFDIRYMLMLRSVNPLRIYAYNVFWLRFTNSNSLRKHFTVMNYMEGVQLKWIHFDEFILFEKRYPQYIWKEYDFYLQCFFSSLRPNCSKHSRGYCPYPSSRAIYAVDLMLKWRTEDNGKYSIHSDVLFPDCSCVMHPLDGAKLKGMEYNTALFI